MTSYLNRFIISIKACKIYSKNITSYYCFNSLYRTFFYGLHNRKKCIVLSYSILLLLWPALSPSLSPWLLIFLAFYVFNSLSSSSLTDHRPWRNINAGAFFLYTDLFFSFIVPFVWQNIFSKSCYLDCPWQRLYTYASLYFSIAPSFSA